MSSRIDIRNGENIDGLVIVRCLFAVEAEKDVPSDIFMGSSDETETGAGLTPLQFVFTILAMSTLDEGSDWEVRSKGH